MTITIEPSSAAEAEVWAVTLDVSRILAGLRWVVVGAQMVMLLEREASRPSARTTGDVDIVVDVRLATGGIRTVTDRLMRAGFALLDPSRPYRLKRGDDQVDILAPDHVGPRADLTTVPPGATIETPGGSRAIATARPLRIAVDGVGTGDVPVPSLAGALAMKVRAWEARREPRDAEDVARLLAVVSDVEDLRRQLKPAERRALGGVSPLAGDHGAAWRVVRDRDDAIAAFDRLRA